LGRIVSVDCRRIGDWSSFHDVFAEAFGFPDFYGRNMDAWIDCMSSLDQTFSAVEVAPDQIVTLLLEEAKLLKENQPEILEAILELSAFVNWRRMEMGDPPILIVSAWV
jgi:RNAse (barnase) inhibitor barstar